MLISYALSNFSECMTSFLEVLGMKRHIGSQLSPLFTYLLHIYSVLLSICTMSTLLLLSSSFKLTHHVLFSVIHVCESYIILFVHFCVRNVQRHFLKCFSQKRHFRSQRFGMHHIFFVWRYVWSVTWELTNNCAECSMSFCMCSILKMHRDLRLEFHLSNYPFIHLLESHFYYSLLIMHHQCVLSAQRHILYILSITCYWLRLVLKLLSWPAGGRRNFVGWMPTPPLLIPGLWLVFVGAFSYRVFWMYHIFFMWRYVWSGTWDCKIHLFLKAGIVTLMSFVIVTVILLMGILYCLHVVIMVNGLFPVALLCPVV